MTPNAQRSLWESTGASRSRQRSAETNALRLEHMCFGVQSLHPTADARASLSPTFLECSPESGMMMNQRLRRVRPAPTTQMRLFGTMTASPSIALFSWAQIIGNT
jgi:hypothetical protein